jgi:hypothetical protein
MTTQTAECGIRAKKIRYPLVKKGKGRFESQKKAKEESKSA